MPLVKPPLPDESLTQFDGGVGVLTRDGRAVGHVATTLTTFWSPFSPLRMQWWVWYIVVWSDGEREPSTEDYPPDFLAVNEMKAGYMEVHSRDASRTGRYDFSWLPKGNRAVTLAELGVRPSDF
jgi:hypothetical protein